MWRRSFIFIVLALKIWNPAIGREKLFLTSCICYFPLCTQSSSSEAAESIRFCCSLEAAWSKNVEAKQEVSCMETGAWMIVFLPYQRCQAHRKCAHDVGSSWNCSLMLIGSTLIKEGKDLRRDVRLSRKRWSNTFGSVKDLFLPCQWSSWKARHALVRRSWMCYICVHKSRSRSWAYVTMGGDVA